MKKIMMVMVLMSLTGMSYANCGNDNGNGNGCSGNVGPQGPQGPSGQDGLNGTNGNNGTNGKDGRNGVDGKNASTRVMPVLDTALRIYDGRFVQLQAFNVLRLADHNKRALEGSTEFMAGARVVFKLGQSYEERRIDALEKKLKALLR